MLIRFASALLVLLLSGCSLLNKKPELIDTDPSAAPIAADLASAYNQGLALMQGEDKAAALSHWLNTNQKWPGYPGVLVNLALSQWQQQQFSDGLSSAEQALALNNDFCPGIKVHALLLRENGQFENAKNEYERALVCDPVDANTPYNLGILYDLYLQDLTKALAYYRQAQTLLGAEDSTLAMWIADLQKRSGATQLAGEDQ